MTKKVVHLAIFASGGGTNAGKIMEYFSENESVRVVVVICNKPRAGVVGVAAAHAVPVHFIDRNSFCHTTELVDVLRQYRADWLVLAGFLWLIPPYIVESFPRRIINIHPALLPHFGGQGMYGHFVHEAVKAAGVRETGITIHYVNERYDEGDILFQARCSVEKDDSPEDIAGKVQVLEHRYFPEIIEKLTRAGGA